MLFPRSVHGWLLGLMTWSFWFSPDCSAERPRPNIIVIFVDDMGFADIGPFGATRYRTPHLDRMAAEGMRFTDFVVSSAVCSASRAALLTGCYHQRIGIDGALGPSSEVGIASSETTLAEICRDQGYATACVGKWHLGHHPRFLPRQHGFDSYFGLPYSNDMWPFHPDYASHPPHTSQRKKGYPDLPLIENEKVIDAEISAEDQTQLTQQYTDRAVNFIEQNQSRPFFLYLAHSMVHVPLFASDTFVGRTQAGLFADVVTEVDWSVGKILTTLDRLKLRERTWVVFTSDNGPWLSYGNHAGSASPLREGKGTAFEGGCRVPTLMWWPGTIPANRVCDELASTIDILPTAAALIGAPLPTNSIDGKNIASLVLDDPRARSPHEAFAYYYANGQLQAVRDRRWKLFFPHVSRTVAPLQRGHSGSPAAYLDLPVKQALYDLHQDIGETRDVSQQHPEVVARLNAQADQFRAELGDRLTEQSGSRRRPPGRLAADDTRLTW